MDVSMRHWPIFATGLLLGAAGTMSLGLHRPTQAELAAAAWTTTVARPATPAASAPVAAVAQVIPDAASQEQGEERMRAAAEAFRAQEALAASLAPLTVAVAQAPKPRTRRSPKDVAAAETVAVAPIAVSDQALQSRPATSVMGAPPAQQVMPARGSAHATESGDSAFTE